MTSDPKKKGLAVLIGIGKPSAPKSAPPKFDEDEGPRGPGQPQGSPGPDGDMDEDDGVQDGPKSTPEDAHCFTSDYRCVTCEHYIHDTHECQKVEGNNFGTEIVGCVDFWEPEGDDASGQGQGYGQQGQQGSGPGPGGGQSGAPGGNFGGGGQGQY